MGGEETAPNAEKGTQAGPANVPQWRLVDGAEIRDRRSVVDGHYVSIVRSDYMDTGGPRIPIPTVNTILWG